MTTFASTRLSEVTIAAHVSSAELSSASTEKERDIDTLENCWNRDDTRFRMSTLDFGHNKRKHDLVVRASLQPSDASLYPSDRTLSTQASRGEPMYIRMFCGLITII